MRNAMIPWLAAPLLMAVPASAQASFEGWQAGPWQVYETGEGCWLVYEPAKGRDLVVVVSRNNYNFYVAVARPDWTWVTDGWKYPVRVRFGKFDELAFGMGFEKPGVSVSYAGYADRGLKAFLTASTLNFRVSAKYTERIDLDPSALRQFGACVTSIDGPGGGGR